MTRQGADNRGLVRQVPWDVWVVLGALVAFVPIVQLGPGNPLRVIATGAILLFLPGYSLTTALFPARPDDRRGDQWAVRESLRERVVSGLDGESSPTLPERLALSFGLSIAVVPLIGLLSTIVLGGLAAETLLAVVGLAAVGTVVGAVRRVQQPAGTRFAPHRPGLGDVRAALAGSGRRERAVNTVLALSVVVALASLAFVFIVPPEDPGHTTASLLTLNQEGELVAANYTSASEATASKLLVVSIQNHGQTSTNYTVVVERQRMSEDGQVLTKQELNRFSQTVEAGETWRERHNAPLDKQNEDVRIAYLIYEGEAPEIPTMRSSDLSLYYY